MADNTEIGVLCRLSGCAVSKSQCDRGDGHCIVILHLQLRLDQWTVLLTAQTLLPNWITERSDLVVLWEGLHV